MFTIRPFDYSDSDYEYNVALCIAVGDAEELAVETVKSADSSRPKKHQFVRFVLEQVGEPIGSVQYFQPAWQYHAHRYFITIRIHPEHSHRVAPQAAYDTLMQQLAPHNPAEIYWALREDQAQLIDCAEANGYEIVMRVSESELAIDAFDFSSYAHVEDKLAALGVTIHTVTELIDRDPVWQRKCYEIDWEIAQDIPMPTKPTRPEWDAYVARFARDTFNPDAWFIAVAKDADDPVGRYVGLSNLLPQPSSPKVIEHGLTGVVRDYRRKGIATALKVRTIAWAKQAGAGKIITGNAENNPMYDLNVALGFVDRPAYLDYKKILRKISN